MRITINGRSPEIISNILPFLGHKDQPHIPFLKRNFHAPKFFPRYATISRKWQQAVEYETFSKLDFSNGEIGEISQLIHPHREDAIGTLVYSVCLPT